MWRFLKDARLDEPLHPLHKICFGHESNISSFVFHPRLPMLAALAKDGTVKAGRLPFAQNQKLFTDTKLLSFSQVWDTNKIAMRNPDGSGILFPIASFSRPADSGPAAGIACRWNSDGTALACTYDDGLVVVFDIEH